MRVQSSNTAPSSPKKKTFTPVSNLTMKEYITSLFKNLDTIPKASSGRNLLFQIKHCKTSARPLSVIHHTMQVFEQAIHKWQECYHQQIYTIVEDQHKLCKRIAADQHSICERTAQLAINNQRFTTALFKHLHNFHLRMTPKKDHHAYKIAKEGCKIFENKQSAKEAVPTTTPEPNQSTACRTKEAVCQRSSNSRLRRLLHLDVSKVHPNADQRSMRKRRRDAVTTLNDVVLRTSVNLSRAHGIHPRDKGPVDDRWLSRG